MAKIPIYEPKTPKMESRFETISKNNKIERPIGEYFGAFAMFWKIRENNHPRELIKCGLYHLQETSSISC